MLVVAGTITFDPPHHEAVASAATKVAEASRLEEGCISYEFFADLTQPGRLLVFEEWEEEHHLVTHFETTHFADFHRVLEASGLKGRNIRRYHVSRSEPNRTS